MNNTRSSQCFGCAFALLAFASADVMAQSMILNPTFTCSGTTNSAANVFAAADVNQALNTKAVGGTDRGNQPRWSWAEPAAFVGGSRLRVHQVPCLPA